MNDTNLYYKEAIEALCNPDTNFFNVCVQLAKNDPKLFCKYAEVDIFDNEIKKLYKEGGLVPAVKHVRAVKGISLREAKDYVDNLLGNTTI